MASADQLPPEIWQSIVEHLCGRDVKNLGLASRYMRHVAPLRFDRVFLSPNPLNIRTFLAIAKHPVYRQQVAEIVYDDARLLKSHREDELLADHTTYNEPDWRAELRPSNREWFSSRRNDNLSDLLVRLRTDYNRPAKIERWRLMDKIDTLMPEDAAWTYYQELLSQQELAILAKADIKAFEVGLESFPNLRRVTITPLAHGFLFTPGYETPMIRAFPEAFNYPLCRGWGTTDYHGQSATEGLSWTGNTGAVPPEVVRDRWRGYCNVTEALAEHSDRHNVTELIVEGSLIRVGLNIHMFEAPNQDYSNLVKIVSRPGFQRLDLSLITGDEKHRYWEILRKGLVREALAQISELQSLTFATDVEDLFSENDPYRQPLPLRIIFPEFTLLKHFRLWNFPVEVTDCISFLSQMPKTLQRVELVLLEFFREEENNRYLLDQMKLNLGWYSWDCRPNLRFAGQDRSHPNQVGRLHWLDTEVDEFLYSGGPNPYGLPDGSWPNLILLPVGVLRDPFDPDYEKPWAYYSQHDMNGDSRPSEFGKHQQELFLGK